VLDMQGIIKNPYFGFFTYMLLGPLFVIGVVLLICGSLFFKSSEDIGTYTYEYLQEQFSIPGRFSRVRRLILLITIIVNVTLVVVLVLSYSAFHYTESTTFCGQFCHNVMEPEYITHQNSPHSRVPCVQCHIGEEAQWFTRSKMTGIRQMVAATFGTYSRPIHTPIGALRPVRETCEKCHRPEKFHGDKLYVKDKYRPDADNSHVQTAMLIKVGSGGYQGQLAHGIHWHVSPENTIVYKHSDRSRQEIFEVKLIRASGEEIVYTRQGAGADKVQQAGEGAIRVMDCMDCHNRPTHIYLTPDEALNQKIFNGEIPRDLPYIKRQALEVVSQKYESTEKAKNAIAAKLMAWYRENYPQFANGDQALLARAIRGVQKAYTENVFPGMNITWGTYRNFIGHEGQSGCLRCHDGSMRTASGATMSTDCESCHILLAENRSAQDVLRICSEQ
jgi:nitrate/TMAO reductase-like tetraheme cytochrome c subunit